ncbi:hypothetical protein EKO27_g5178 [Xylaria grammica]|uniref:HD domain-containing protein n=1 Tax=Xylaria grammica TaxID=363999 RepID=A0A439D684_9PEZI|nr:hypothetical protein F5X98DRAFT_367475 [Xylaria grammica]RWA09911.1 hypothetical protein EKO27_g5178 [Xylaria grammica]GAW23119.1 hypothetical protein ANO14919_126690 [Xylariales sp. No.14919]
MKFSGVLPVLALAGAAAAKPGKYPTTTIAGVEVVDTPLVREARQLIEVFNELQPYLYKHLHRTWLFGAAAINANETLKATIDLEFHAVGSLLHDLGWDMRPNSPYVTQEDRFEVDSGVAAVNFVKDQIKNDKCSSKKWSASRLEKLYDGIALQTEQSIIKYKNVEAQWIVNSVGFEFPGPRNPLIPEAAYNSVLAAYPNDYLFRGSNITFTYLAGAKPVGTYNTFLQDFGEAYVPGYDPSGYTFFDLIHEGIEQEVAKNPNATIYS